MGIRCLLGHDFGEPELKRDREEKGEEVIVTVSEQQTCSRCGATKVVSENTEVTSIQQLTETADDESAATPSDETAPEATAGDAGDASDDAPQSTATEVTADDDDGITITDDAELLTDDDEPTGEEPAGAAEPTEPTDAVETAEATEASETAEDTEPAETDEPTDDGVILSGSASDADTTETAETSEGERARADSATSDDREAGEWPEYEGDSQPGEEPTAWPEQAGEDDGFDATSPSDEGPDDVTFGGGFTPEVADADAQAAGDAEGEEVIEEPEELTKAEEASVYEPTVDDINTEFYCPECGFSRPSGESSMRAGDICPDCRRGYIAERRR
ncbi:hypothetical protein EGH24_01775 [Halonotius terrestris]|uniref:Uncharacterized protein n=1 Tax=Halonotius terrestris TaxID=2487750 RepID=A0A8J8TDH8_9EURY|nr:hypothetical protein [Halonotius terrestris]TQQ83546.1 hypothetical protein EGH24_01775 [Halonotius terrestris]